MSMSKRYDLSKIILNERLKSKITDIRINYKPKNTNTSLKYEIKAPIIENVAAPEWGNFFNYNKNQKLTYNKMPQFQLITASGNWATDGRTELRPAKLITYLFEQNPIVSIPIEHCLPLPPETALNEYIKEFTAKIFNSNGLQIDVTEDIQYVYEMPPTTSDLHTCMHDKGFHINKFYDHLRHLGVEVSVLYITTSDHQLKARALLWDNVKTVTGETIKVMDRFYGDLNMWQIFKDYAATHGYYIKENHRTYADWGLILHTESGQTIQRLHAGSYYLHLSGEFSISESPYMDTFFALIKNPKNPYAEIITNNVPLGTPIIASFREQDFETRFNDSRGCSVCQRYLYSDNEIVKARKTNDAPERFMHRKCFDRYYLTCTHCGNSHDKRHMHQFSTGYICSDCFNSYYHSCYICARAININNQSGYFRNRRNDTYYCCECVEAVRNENQTSAEVAEAIF